MFLPKTTAFSAQKFTLKLFNFKIRTIVNHESRTPKVATSRDFERVGTILTAIFMSQTRKGFVVADDNSVTNMDFPTTPDGPGPQRIASLPGIAALSMSSLDIQSQVADNTAAESTNLLMNENKDSSSTISPSYESPGFASFSHTINMTSMPGKSKNGFRLGTSRQTMAQARHPVGEHRPAKKQSKKMTPEVAAILGPGGVMPTESFPTSADSPYLRMPNDVHFAVFDSLIANRTLEITSHMHMHNSIRNVKRLNKQMYALVKTVGE